MTDTKTPSNLSNIEEIEHHLPHRAPFLMIDRILECTPGQSLRALKNITYNEPCFSGHFPQKPIFPGVLIVEAIAQATGLLFSKTFSEAVGILYLAGVDETRFKHIVTPGDQLIIEINVLKARRDLWKAKGVASVDDKIACTSTVILAREATK